MKNLKIQILIDNSNSWMWHYVDKIKNEILRYNSYCKVIDTSEKVEKGDILILLSCEQIFKDLNLNRFNLVIHESNLPRGKGFSPLTWQVIEGKNKIPICLLEADEKVDSGAIYFKDYIELEGHELINEIREKQFSKTLELISRFVSGNDFPKKTKQSGLESFYRRRKKEDSIIDTNQTISSLFNKLRTIDNTRYPAYFNFKGYKYLIKIEKFEKIEK